MKYISATLIRTGATSLRVPIANSRQERLKFTHPAISQMEILASNATQTNPSFHWEDGPNVRGTLEIINLCLSTLFICIWSTLHFDIPNKRLSAFRDFLPRMGWMLIALLFPEFLLLVAVAQKAVAGALVKEAVDHLPSQLSLEVGKFTRVFNY